MTAVPQTNAPQPVPSMLQGRIDAVAGGRLFGWAWDRNRPDDRLRIEARRGEDLIAATDADAARADLRHNGIGDGAHAFETEVGESDNRPLVVVAISPATGARLLLEAVSPEEAQAEGLQRLAAMVERMAVAQRQIANATHGLLRDLRDAQVKDASSEAARVEETIAGMTAIQQGMQKQIATVEVFLLRFDTVLREFDRRLENATAPRSGGGPLGRIGPASALLAVIALVVALWK